MTSVVGRWWLRAACRGMDPELFYPERGGMADVAAAKRVCMSCPVRAECLEDALTEPTAGDSLGIRGGLLANERRRLRRERSVS